MNEIKAITKDLAILTVLQLMLAVVASISIGVLIVGFTVLALYMYHFSIVTIITSAFAAWFVYLIILAIIVYVEMKVFQRKKRNFIDLMNKQLLASIGIKTINSILRKFRKKKITAQNEM